MGTSFVVSAAGQPACASYPPDADVAEDMRRTDNCYIFLPHALSCHQRKIIWICC